MACELRDDHFFAAQLDPTNALKRVEKYRLSILSTRRLRPPDDSVEPGPVHARFWNGAVLVHPSEPVYGEPYGRLREEFGLPRDLEYLRVFRVNQ